ncbi:MAG: hypothetical protein AAB579_02725 [Patescibacteria group bacterium]
MKHLLVTTLALLIGFLVGFGISYTTEKPDTAPVLRTDGGPEAATGPGEAVVVFAPGGLYTSQEKDYLTTNVTQPFVLYHHLAAEPVVSVMVEKSTANAREVHVTAIRQNGAYGGFIHPINQPWVPECFDRACRAIPDKFKTLYPALYQEATRRAQ